MKGRGPLAARVSCAIESGEEAKGKRRIPVYLGGNDDRGDFLLKFDHFSLIFFMTSGTGITPKLSTFDASMIVVSLVIGIGIFRTPAIVASHAGSATMFYGAWILGGVISLFGALTFAEIGSRVPRPGAFYQVVVGIGFVGAGFPLYLIMRRLSRRGLSQ